VLTHDDVAQLGDVLISTAEGRTSDGDITVRDSTGVAIQDLAIALAAIERATSSSCRRSRSSSRNGDEHLL
jgi:ornithine cyclodeaminase/alanine dehydrogenase-like protein (mu-crystallin family)